MSESTQLIVFGLLLACLPVALFWKPLRGSEGFIRSVIGISVGLMLVIGLVLYAQLGSWVDLKIRDDYQAMLQRINAGQNPDPAEYQALLDRMAVRGERRNDPDYFYLLANEYRAAEDFQTASRYFEKVAEVWPDDSGILSAWAETEYMAQGFLMTPRVESLIDRTLRVDPNNSTVLGILGIDAFRGEQYADAIEYWSRILVGLPPMSPNRQVLEQSIDRAEQMMELSGDLSAAPVAQDDQATTGQGIAVELSYLPGVEPGPQAAVFVFARVPGSPMPLAVQRLSPSQVPGLVVLDDSMVMIPGTQLAGMPQLELVARLSQTGQPIAQSGDFEVVVQVTPTQFEEGVSLQIGQPVQP